MSENNLPKGWITGAFEEVVDILDNKRIPINQKERDKKRGNIPYYGATGLVGYIDDYLFDEELVLLGEDGAPFLESSKDKAYLINGKSWVNNHAHVLRGKKDVLINKYLCHYLNIVGYQQFVTGTTRLKLNQSRMKVIPILIPPLNEQHRIVAKIEELFTKLDAGVEALKKAKALIKQYRQSVLKAAFEGKLTAEWRKKNKATLEPASKLLERIKEEREKKLGKKYKKLLPVDASNLPELPEGWAWCILGEILTVSSGNFIRVKQLTPNGMYPVYGGNGINGYNNEYMFENRKLIIGRVGVHCGNVHITEPKSWVTDNALVVDFSTINMKFLMYSLRRLNLNELSVSTAQPVISGSKIYPIVMRVPSLKEQVEIAEIIENTETMCNKLEELLNQSWQQSNKLRQSILKQAFEGKLVPQDPNDEPAEKLLEKIKAEKAKSEGVTKARSNVIMKM